MIRYFYRFHCRIFWYSRT